jgi:DNA-binding NarL/FixJ family response regulator
MTLSSLVISADQASGEKLRGVLDDLGFKVESCAEEARAAVRLAQEHYDLLVLDCPTKAAVALLKEARSSKPNEAILAVVVAEGQEHVREMFSLGVNFVVYKPVLVDRVLASLTAAQAVLHRDKRRKARAAVHAQATIDFAGGEPMQATLVDLAETGMAVNFGKHLPPTCKVYFQFQLPGQKATVRLSGQVVWQEWSGRAGVQFVDVPQSSRRLLTEWLQKNLGQEPETPLAAVTVDVKHSIVPGQGQMVTVAEPRGKGHDRDALARLRLEPSNRREQTRYACRLGAEVYQQGSSVRNYCHLSDLSPGGCYLEMQMVFPAGTAIEITVRTHEMKLRLSGEVKASHPGYGMGILFKLNTKDERYGVQQLIDFVAATTETSS